MKLSDKTMLVVLNIRQWSGERLDRRVTEEACQANNASSNAGRFKKYLLSKSAVGAIKKLAGDARSRHYQLTLPWADDGARIISSLGYLKYRDEMTGYKNRFNELTEQFLHDYPGYVSEAQDQLGDMFNKSEYPHNGDLAARFGFEVRIRPTPDAGDFRCQLADAEIKAIRDSIEADTVSALDTALADVTERMRRSVSHMAEKLHGYDGGKEGSFHTSMVENMRELVDILPTLNITSDTRIDSLIADMKRELTLFDAVELREDSAARLITARKADEILDKMKDYGL